MMAGHAMLAFAIATTVASIRWSRERALAFGLLAGAFATVPDVDMLYALFGLLQVGLAGVWTMADAFWGSSTLVHRAVTHSLVVAGFAAVAFAGSASRRGRPVAALLSVGLTIVAFFESGPLGGAIMLAFLAAGLAVAAIATKTTDFGQRELLVAAVFGLSSHPFGDLFTGSPPRFFYPFDVTVFTGRVSLVADPTLNLVAIFAVELATIWLAGHVYLRTTDRRLRTHVDARAAVGVAYAIAAVVLPAPTLDVSYHFVFSILALGTVGVAPRFHPSRSLLSAEWHERITWVMTGLAAVTVATLAYALAYVLYPIP